MAARKVDKPHRADIVQKVGNIFGALAYKQLSSHVIINMDDNDDDLLQKIQSPPATAQQDLLHPCTTPPV